MPESPTFHAWWRPEITGLVDDVAGGRALATTALTLRRTLANGTEDVYGSAYISFPLAGPSDVLGLRPGAISSRFPAPRTPDAETTMQPYVEFHDPGLPWRYTPTVNPEEGDESTLIRPWLVLVVGERGRNEVEVQGDRAWLSAKVCEAYPLAESARHCHVQVTDETVVSRLLSARPLEPDTDYVAALVAAYPLANDATTEYAWDGDDHVTVALYDLWHFRTGAAGDFRSLALRLAPRVAVDLGRAPVEYGRLDDAPETEIRGALAPLGSSDAELDPAIGADLAGLRTPSREGDDVPDGAGRPVVGLPAYGSLWADLEASAWGQELNGDPRHRGAAGLGASLAFDQQAALSEEVGRQAGALDAADRGKSAPEFDPPGMQRPR